MNETLYMAPNNLHTKPCVFTERQTDRDIDTDTETQRQRLRDRESIDE